YTRLGSSTITILLFDHHQSLVVPNIAQSRRFTPLGFSTLTPLPGPNVSELPIITASTFTTRSPNNTPLANRASILAILNLVISPAFIEANYEVLESLLRDRRRHVCNEDVRTELDYYSEEYDEEREMEPRPTRMMEATPILQTGSPRARRHRGRVVEFKEAPNRDKSRVERESDGRRPSERRVEDDRSHEGNLPQLLAAHLGRNKNGHPLQSTLTSGYGGNQPSITLGGNPLSNAKKVATNGAPNDHKEDSNKFSKGFSLDNNKGRKKIWERFSPYKGSNHGLLENLVKSPREILAIDKAANAFEQPPCMAKASDTQLGEWRKGDKYVAPTKALILMNSREDHIMKRKIMEGSEYLEDKSTRSLRVDSKIPLVGFSRKQSWSLGEVHLEVTIGESPYTRTEILNFVIVSNKVSYPLPRWIGTIHSSYDPNKVEEDQKKIKESVLVAMKGMLSCIGSEERIVVNNQYLEQTVVIGKQLPTSFKRKLQELLRANVDVFAWTYADMTRIPKTIMLLFLESLIIPYWKCPIFDNDDDEEYTIQVREYYKNSPVAFTPGFLITNSLIMEDEHLDTIPETESDKENESSVEGLNLTPSESEDLSDIESDDDESSSEEDVPVENFKIYSNPLLEFNEEIFSSEINSLYNEVLEDLDSIPPENENDHFNAESDLIESLLNKDTVITSPKTDFLLEEFVGELALLNPIPPRIDETNFDPKEDIRLIKKLLYDNSSPRPPEELNSEISDAMIESFSSSPIPVKDSDSLMEDIDIFLAADDLILPGIDSDGYDSEEDNLFI
ncbi:hypothetical protein Tco_1021348, partial [Tanacetum coccineum]